MRINFLELIGEAQWQERSSEMVAAERIALAEAGAANWELEPPRWSVQEHPDLEDAYAIRAAIRAKTFDRTGLDIELVFEDGEENGWRFETLSDPSWTTSYASSYATACEALRVKPIEDYWPASDTEEPNDALEQSLTGVFRLFAANRSPADARRLFIAAAERVAR